MINYNKAFALPNEVWNPVVGYEGLYKVSSMGKVKNLITGKILRPARSHNGYLVVTLYKDGKRKHFKVHRLVAEAFLGNPDNLPQINHLDEDKTNNHYSNLEWVTPKENINWGTCITRISKSMTNGKLAKKVYQYSLDGKFIKKWPSTNEVERKLGYAQSNVSACCRGEKKTAYGFIWRYKQ